jgi:DNA helicase HerA-like ATPase
MAKINIGTEINLEDLLQSRLLIQANSGGGKSVLARVIIEETFGKVHFIVMDIEGEYYTLKEKYGDVLDHRWPACRYSHQHEISEAFAKRNNQQTGFLLLLIFQTCR